jgi:hypothetical protein
MLLFDEKDHSYRLDGVIVPSVTQVLKDISSFSFDTDIMARAAAFGTAVHKSCELYDKDDLDVDSLDVSLRPYLDSWIKFKKETGFIPSMIEARVFSEKYRYAGTLDRVGVMQGKEVLIDIKTGVPVPSIGLQLAGYEIAAKETFSDFDFPKTIRRAACFLSATGYKLKEYKDNNDHAIFLSYLNIYNWRNKHAS